MHRPLRRVLAVESRDDVRSGPIQRVTPTPTPTLRYRQAAVDPPCAAEASGPGAVARLAAVRLLGSTGSMPPPSRQVTILLFDLGAELDQLLRDLEVIGYVSDRPPSLHAPSRGSFTCYFSEVWIPSQSRMFIVAGGIE